METSRSLPSSRPVYLLSCNRVSISRSLSLAGAVKADLCLVAAQAESLPTAFTPRFEGRGSFPGSAQSVSSIRTDTDLLVPSLITSTLQLLPRSASQTLPASTSTARFGSPAPSASSSALFRRRRPVYVGAGYSSQAARRRKANAAAASGEGGLTRSQSVGMVYEMSGSKTEEPSVADGKRRKVVEDSDDAPPPFATTEVPIPPSPSVAPSPAKASVPLGPKYSVISTPARPSPLWQVSKAGPYFRRVRSVARADYLALQTRLLPLLPRR